LGSNKNNWQTDLIWNFLYPPKSTQDIWGELESSIEMAINDTAIDDVIITGDFNDNQLDYSRTKISSLLTTKFSLAQMIDEPTHFTEHSSSLIDLILTNVQWVDFKLENVLVSLHSL
jgi:hypothetical protein